MEVGDIVDIFTDPITEQNLEGRAKLLWYLDPNDPSDLEYWKVKFLDDNFETERLIKRR